MSYTRAQYDKAMAVLEERQMRAKSEAAACHDRAVAADPRVAEIERLLSSTAVKLSRIILDGMQTGEHRQDVSSAVQTLQNENQQLQRELAQRLHALGYPQSDFEPQPTCPHCGDTGYNGRQMCGCLKALLGEIACEELSALSHMTLTRFSDFDLQYYSARPDAEGGGSPRERMADILAYCRAYAADFSTDSPSLLLRGPAGTGKTFLSLAIAGTVAAAGRQVVYGSVQRLLRQMEKEHFGKADGDSATRLEECDLLILDDIGTEFASPFYTSALYELINARLLAGVPTVLSTNLNAKQLQERYGVQIASRINGCFQPLVFCGTDIRGQKRLRELGE